ncbi:hypothetical protein AC579_4086 [Pseudocercospora musae]|uniref:Uncharacterized protein n=1 Tax=Pseudocercospora musae TaxID=113226 RepID=A0A139IJA9_9PEZI|nr:hypothetical protein AC579_4086 [Pseudocercospora musae]
MPGPVNGILCRSNQLPNLPAKLYQVWLWLFTPRPELTTYISLSDIHSKTCLWRQSDSHESHCLGQECVRTTPEARLKTRQGVCSTLNNRQALYETLQVIPCLRRNKKTYNGLVYEIFGLGILQNRSQPPRILCCGPFHHLANSFSSASNIERIQQQVAAKARTNGSISIHPCVASAHLGERQVKYSPLKHALERPPTIFQTEASKLWSTRTVRYLEVLWYINPEPSMSFKRLISNKCAYSACEHGGSAASRLSNNPQKLTKLDPKCRNCGIGFPYLTRGCKNAKERMKSFVPVTIELHDELAKMNGPDKGKTVSREEDSTHDQARRYQGPSKPAYFTSTRSISSTSQDTTIANNSARHVVGGNEYEGSKRTGKMCSSPLQIVDFELGMTTALIAGVEATLSSTDGGMDFGRFLLEHHLRLLTLIPASSRRLREMRWGERRELFPGRTQGMSYEPLTNVLLKTI